MSSKIFDEFAKRFVSHSYSTYDMFIGSICSNEQSILVYFPVYDAQSYKRYLRSRFHKEMKLHATVNFGRSIFNDFLIRYYF